MRNWKYVIAVAAIGLAAFLLYRTLSRYSLDQLVAAVTAVPGPRLLGAMGFAAASYLSLTLFDYLALHYVKRPLPYRQTALASFTALSLGHNIGLAALSSGAVRYRFYDRWGLKAAEVAKVIVFCGITVGLGLLVLGGAALMLRSGLAVEITGLTRPVVLALGAGCLALPTLYLILAAFVRKPLTIRRWSLEMPPLRLAIGQVLVGSVNFAFVAACLHQTLAAVADVAYPGVASVYVIANATALVSHVPGGLGVIESVVMYLLPQADLIGPLLVFRFVYFLVPLVLGSILLAVTELVYRRRAGAYVADGIGANA
ncbi:putative bifunctional lysylphosphatidylglycerol flippase/synthetase [Microvirga lotononidis]|uniref:Putative integral membrane protein n=1 Tax=Microvirga lotononidis TaxID=864069 RepID=I4YVZ4_9HYPH|nr:lysylphosphatidylglycerol synthase domain-containing protein [Microvirga lotononidis]EIM28136.1 putative integral membrane protein [Microvirga lotononidis]WQO27759.1 lysylphosphatidylglycerol synthase domain-containing protein [Microvirga lotononidis]